MSMQSIREQYGVPAKRGAKVLFQGHPGVITSADRVLAYLYLRMDSGQTFLVHPTWEMDYLDGKGVR